MDDKIKNRLMIGIAVLLGIGVVLLGVFDAPDVQPVGVIYGEPSSDAAGQETVVETVASATEDAAEASADNTPASQLSAATPAQSTAAQNTTAPTSGKVNLNTASKSELMTLKGIGEVYAERIIAYRETHSGFDTIEEIMQVKGIGEKTFEKLRDYITV